MDFLKKHFHYLILLLTYYGLTLLIKDTSSGINILMLIIPILVFIMSIHLGTKRGFTWIFPLLATILWLPNIFIFNESIGVYSVFYGAVSLLGVFVGHLIYKRRK